MNNTLTLARDRANDFARLHLQECAVELLRWKRPHSSPPMAAFGNWRNSAPRSLAPLHR